MGPPNTRTQTPSYDNTPHTFYPWLEPASRITPASDSLAIQAMGWEDELQSCQEMGFLSSDIMSYYSGYEDLDIYHGEWPPISADTEHSQPRLLPLQGPDPSSDLSERGRSQFETSTIPKSPERPAVKRKPGRSQYKVQKQPIQRLPKRSSRAPYLPRTPCPIPGCEVTVARPTDIRRHLSTRHGGERYACLLCAAERGNANRVEHLYGTKYNLLE